MARITVEDCMDHVDNLFELVLIASKRARRVANGAEPFVEWENDKPTVIALREIAAGFVNVSILTEPERNEPMEEAAASFNDPPPPHLPPAIPLDS